MSFGNYEVHEEINRRIVELTKAGIIFIASSGNEGPLKSSATNPCSLQQVICVGMLDGDLKDISVKSSYGMNRVDLTSGVGLMAIDVLLPGDRVFIINGSAFGQCDIGTGTSFSAAIMTGVVAGFLSAT